MFKSGAIVSYRYVRLYNLHAAMLRHLYQMAYEKLQKAKANKRNWKNIGRRIPFEE